jgi:ABC-2 type transport system ATP-binding protein
LSHVLGLLVDLEVRSLTTSPPTLEELFLRHYGEEIAAPAREAAEVVTVR